MKNNIRIIAIGIAAFLFGILFHSIFWGGGSQVTEKEEMIEETQEETTWTCSMHPQIRQPEPGQCPICGMDLIPLENGGDGGDVLAVQMTETAMRLANIRTMEVGRSNPVKEIRLNGKVTENERLVKTQSAHIPGRVEELFVNTTGEYVREGQKLASIYSPPLITAQQELLQGAAIRETQPALYKAAVEKLRAMRISKEQIETIVESGQIQENLLIFADRPGIVLEKKVNVGDYLNKGDVLFTIADLSRVWVLFDAYESDLPWIDRGDRLDFRIASIPGEEFNGRITFIDPIVNPLTRVAKIRVEAANPGYRLKPEMFATGFVQAQLGGEEEKLTIPKTAVMWTGDRSVVYVSDPSAGQPSFRLREVKLGPTLADQYVVEEGLEAGERIVVHGTFTVDAAAQLAGKPSMMDPEAGLDQMVEMAGMKVGHQHEKIEVTDEIRKQIYNAMKAYLKMKDELVRSNLSTGIEQAGEILEKLNAVEASNMGQAAREKWKEMMTKATDNLKNIQGAGDLGAVRSTFKPFSDLMVEIAMTFGPFEQTIYVQHCPMADDFKGANWLSNSDRIRNPYFGDKMLKCGSVTDSIK